MPCPHNQFGSPQCNIVQHPDRPDESFCATCGKSFQNQESAGSGLSILLAVIASVLGLFMMNPQISSNGGSNPNPQVSPSAPVALNLDSPDRTSSLIALSGQEEVMGS